MVEQKDLDRINFLARKAKTEGLTEEETAERQVLRSAYLEEIRASVRAALDNTYIMDEKGNKTRLKKKN